MYMNIPPKMWTSLTVTTDITKKAVETLRFRMALLLTEVGRESRTKSRIQTAERR